jgi:rubrerythrin
MLHIKRDLFLGDIDMKTLICKRCNYKWYPRIPKPPRQCPHCKNPRWNEAKRGK